MSGPNKRLNTESSMGRINNLSVPKYPILKTSALLLNSIYKKYTLPLCYS